MLIKIAFIVKSGINFIKLNISFTLNYLYNIDNYEFLWGSIVLKDNRAVLVKVCGLTDTVEADYLNKNKVDFAGFVLFFPKSKRNISIEKAEQIMAELDENIKKVAVIVSPDESEIQQIRVRI